MSAANNLNLRLVRAVQAAPVASNGRPRGSKRSGKAKTLTPEQLDHLLHVAQGRARDPLRDYVIILLSFKAGLRACEIAGLSWIDVTGPDGKVGEVVEGEVFFTVPDHIAKNGQGRTIPMHPVLQAALEHHYRNLPANARGERDPVVSSLEGPRLSPNALSHYVNRLFKHAGLRGCSSHSGRRTLLTKLARDHHNHGCSLFDVQDIAGHAGIESTVPYVEPSAGVSRMIRRA